MNGNTKKLHGWITPGYDRQINTEFGRFERKYEKAFLDKDEENKRKINNELVN